MSMAQPDPNQQRLNLFEGKEVDHVTVRLGSSAQLSSVSAAAYGAPVAYLVMGYVDGVTFTSDDDGQLTRSQRVKTTHLVEMDRRSAVELFDRIDRQRQADAGIVQLFD